MILLICSGPLASTGQTFTFAVHKVSDIEREYGRVCFHMEDWILDLTVHEWLRLDGKWSLKDTYQWQ